MAYTNKVPAAVAFATTVVFLAVTMGPGWTEAQSSMPKLDPLCAIGVPEIVQVCYFTLNPVPSDECCNSLKSASQRRVTCLCDNFIDHPSNVNLTRAFYDEVHKACGVQDKYACKGGNANGGATNKIAASMGLFGLIASLFL